MKTVFRKRILPLAMVASLAVSGLAGTYTASAAVNPDNSGIAIVSEVATGDLIIGKYTSSKAVSFDVLDNNDTELDYTLEFTGLNEFSNSDLELDKLMISDDGKNPYPGIAITSITKGKKASGSGTSTFYKYTLKAKVKKTTVAKENGLKLYYNGDELLVSEKNGESIFDNFGITVTIDQQKNKTKITNGAISYGTAGNNKNVDLSMAGDGVTKIAANGFKGNANIQTVKIPANITSIDANAFNSCKNLVMLEVDSRTDDLTIADNAFTAKGNVIILAANATTIEKVKFANKPDGIVVMNKTDIARSSEILEKNENFTFFIDSTNKNVYDENGEKLGSITVKENDIDDDGKKETIYDLDDATMKNVEWSIVNENGSKTPAGKILSGGKYSATKLKTDAKVISVGALNSNAAFNNTSTIVAKVKIGSGSAAVTYELASFTFEVKPDFVKGYTDLTKKTSANKPWEKVYKADNKYYLKEKYPSGVSTGYDEEYDLDIYEGVSYKLPFAAADGQYKNLYYRVNSGGEGFTVVAGTVKGLTGGVKYNNNGKPTKTGEITIIPQDQNNTAGPKIKVNVTVQPVVKALKANTTSLTLVGSTLQSFTVRANPVSHGKITANVKVPEGYELYYDGTKITGDTKPVTITGAQEFEVKKTTATAKGVIEFSYRATGANADKTLKINVAPAVVYKNVASVKVTGKVDKATQKIKLNVPVGTLYDLGVSVQPVTANNKVNWTVNEDGNTKDDVSNMYMIGDVFNAQDVGTFDVYATTSSKDQNNKKIKSTVYEISVYKPGDSIVWKDASYILRGGVMVDKDHSSVTTVNASDKKIEITAPGFTNGSNENITWTSNKPASMYIKKAGSTKLELYPTVAGTYTVSGISDITKQKFTFKVNVSELATFDISKISIKPGNVSVKVGEKVQLYLEGEGTNAKSVAWKSSEATVASVANGLITGKKVGSTTITATLNGDSTKIVTCTITVTAADAVVTIKKAPAFVKKGEAIATTDLQATVKNATGDPAWKIVSKSAFDNGNKTAIDITPSTGIGSSVVAGLYYIYPVYGTANEDAAVRKEIYICNDVATAIKVLDPKGYNKIADLKGTKDGQGIGALKEKNNTSAGAKVYIPLQLTKKNGRADEALDASKVGEIEWTSDNINVATAKHTTTEEIDEDYKVNGANAYVEITLSNKDYKGLVKLTGAAKNNGNAKTTVSLYVINNKCTKIESYNLNATKITLPNKTVAVTIPNGKTEKEVTISGTYTPDSQDEILYTELASIKSKAKFVDVNGNVLENITIDDVSWNSVVYAWGKNNTPTARAFTMKVTVKNTAANCSAQIVKLKIDDKMTTLNNKFKFTIKGAGATPASE